MHPEPPPIPKLEARLAPVMFAASFLYLLTVAGLVHRAYEPEVTDLELEIMTGMLSALWPIFAGEAILSFFRRSRNAGTVRVLARVLFVLALPPVRLAWVHPRTDRIWLPRLGWRAPSRELLRLLDRLFGGPMLLFAFLILPALGVEYVQFDLIHSEPWLASALHLSIAAIWVAFAVEFIVKCSAAPSSLVYLKERWLDLAIVILPTLEFILTRWVDAAPLARLFKLGRALSPQQLGAMGKAYRLRGLMMKGWHAFLLLEGVARILGTPPEKRLRKIENQIANLEEELRELRTQALALRKTMIVFPQKPAGGDAGGP